MLHFLRLLRLRSIIGFILAIVDEIIISDATDILHIIFVVILRIVLLLLLLEY